MIKLGLFQWPCAYPVHCLTPKGSTYRARDVCFLRFCTMAATLDECAFPFCSSRMGWKWCSSDNLDWVLHHKFILNQGFRRKRQGMESVSLSFFHLIERWLMVKMQFQSYNIYISHTPEFWIEDFDSYWLNLLTMLYNNICIFYLSL